MFFATYGPSFAFAGQLRYVEAVLLGWSVINAQKLLGEMKGLSASIVQLFVLAGAMHLVSGLINDSPPSAMVARSGTYMLLAVLLLALLAITRHDRRRLAFVLAGYAASYVFILFVGTSTSRGYALSPWRLGLGFASMIALAVLFVSRPRLLRLAPFAFVAISGVHLAMGSRSFAGQALLVAALTGLASVMRRSSPAPFRYGRVAVVLLVISAGAWIAPKTLVALGERDMLTEEMNSKMQVQATSSVGFWTAARPDTATALTAISQKPFIGFGPGVVDPEIYALYARLAAASLATDSATRQALLFQRLAYDWELGTPSHSHLFGAWADAGVLSAACWVVVLGLAIWILAALIGFYHPWAPLYTLMAVSTIWDVLFSPGPNRMDIALRIVVLLVALRHFQLPNTMRVPLVRPGAGRPSR